MAIFDQPKAFCPPDNIADLEAKRRLGDHVDKHSSTSKGLLPAGLSDLLSFEAEQSARAIEAVLTCFSQFGYQRVKPPLLEFEHTLLADGPGAALADQTFRLLDPVSRQMMALRSDMTAQIARISGTRFAGKPRPLRIAYSGEVMRVVPDVLNPERQLVQVGAEIIGRVDSLAATEIIMLGVRALQSAGIEDVTIDLNLPHLFEILLDDQKNALDAEMREQVFAAVRDRDITRLSALPVRASAPLIAILEASGASTAELRMLSGELGGDAGQKLASLLDVAEDLASLLPHTTITLDPLDMQGFGYHTSIGFSLYAADVRGAIARGGAYITGYDETAMGLSIYMDRVLRNLPVPATHPQIYIPAALGLAAGLVFIQRGRHIIYGSAGADPEREARDLDCAFMLREAGGQPESL